MDINLKGKNALVCGSSKGIGKASALELALLGANVTLVSRSAEKMAAIIGQLDDSKDQQHDFLVADFTDSADLSKKVRGLVALKPIHILVNNTGGPPAGPILNADPKEFVQAFHNHIICSHILTKQVVEGMKAAAYGRIINVISTSVKEPIAGLGVSNTTRGAMGNWAKTMAGELGGFGITVNNVLPGYTATERLTEIIHNRAKASDTTPDAVQQKMRSTVPAGRFADAHEVGGVVAFLATPAAGYVNGINVPVDGGRTRSL
ncbi:MAG: SDR family oxidoreductase [Bacteroidota bacterium]